MEWVVPARPHWKHGPQQVGDGLDQWVYECGLQTCNISVTSILEFTLGLLNHKPQGWGSTGLSSGASRWCSSMLKFENHRSCHTHYVDGTISLEAAELKTNAENTYVKHCQKNGNNGIWFLYIPKIKIDSNTFNIHSNPENNLLQIVFWIGEN